MQSPILFTVNSLKEEIIGALLRYFHSGDLESLSADLLSILVSGDGKVASTSNHELWIDTRDGVGAIHHNVKVFLSKGVIEYAGSKVTNPDIARVILEDMMENFNPTPRDLDSRINEVQHSIGMFYYHGGRDRFINKMTELGFERDPSGYFNFDGIKLYLYPDEDTIWLGSSKEQIYIAHRKASNGTRLFGKYDNINMWVKSAFGEY